MANLQKTLDVERVVNLVKAFDWQFDSREDPDDRVIIKFSKRYPAEPVPTSEKMVIGPSDVGKFPL